MNPEIKAKWVAALRSGKYEQAKSRLRRDSDNGSLCMCCLGVLCDVVDPDGWDVRVNFGTTHRQCVDTPPANVLEAAGFKPTASDAGGWSCPSVPYVEIRGESMALYRHNDNGVPFAEIADAIEAQL